MGKTKLVYEDSGKTKLLWGMIVGEDDLFISFRTEDGNCFRINKTNIIFIKEIGGGNA